VTKLQNWIYYAKTGKTKTVTKTAFFGPATTVLRPRTRSRDRLLWEVSYGKLFTYLLNSSRAMRCGTLVDDTSHLARLLAVALTSLQSTSIVSRYSSRVSCLCGSVRNLQRRFPIDDVMLRSGDNRDQVANSPKFLCFWPPKFLTEFYESGSPSNTWQSLVTSAAKQPRRLGAKKRKR